MVKNFTGENKIKYNKNSKRMAEKKALNFCQQVLVFRVQP